MQRCPSKCFENWTSIVRYDLPWLVQPFWSSLNRTLFPGPCFSATFRKGDLHILHCADFKMATYIFWKNSRRITSEVAPLLNTAKKSPLPGSVIVWNEWRHRTLVCFVLWQKSKWIIMFLKRPVGRKISKCSTLYF